MNFVRPFLLGFALCVSPLLVAKEEVIALYESHRVVVDVPEGSTFTLGTNDLGVVTLKIVDPKQAIDLEISLLPDPDGSFFTPRSRREFIVDKFQRYVAGSVEKEMRFTELKPQLGSVTSCVFTDASLAGKTEFPPNDYLNATVGLKSWPGCAAFFTLLSNGVDSSAYQAAIKVITDSLRDQKPPPLR